MSDPFIGTINMFGFTFAPRNWSSCSGQLINIGQQTTLYSLLGTTYGGDGRTTFGLPDLRGRSPVNVGRYPGSSFNYYQGQMIGYEYVSITTQNLPAHSHAANFTSTSSFNVSKTPFANQKAAADNYYIGSNNPVTGKTEIYSDTAPASGDTAAIAGLEVSGTIDVTNTGGSQQLINIQPVIALNFCIAMAGLYPPRN